MRGLAAHIGHKACENAALELQHVGWCHITGHQHKGVFSGEVSCAALNLPLLQAWAKACTGQNSKQSFDHLFDVGLALAQIGVFHVVKLPDQDFQLGRQRPLGVVMPFTDPQLDGIAEHVVMQQHQVYVQQGRQLVWRLGRQLAFKKFQLCRHGIAGAPDARNLVRHLLGAHKIVGYVHTAGGHQNGPPNGHATRHRKAENLNAHRALRS